MKLEHRKENVVTLSRFILRLGRYSLFALALIIFSLSLGVVGYHYFGQLDWLTSFHMASMILTGMGPVAVINARDGILFSSFYALYSGVAFLSITAVFLAPIIHRLLHILHVETDEGRNS